MANAIIQFMHCRQCLATVPDGQSPREWARLECGWTQEGWQVWCVRHECQVVAFDLMGHQVRLLRDPTTH